MMVSRILIVGSDDPAVAVCAHASCIRPLIAVENRFVILRGFEWDHVVAIANHDEADFFAL
jgi:hypothetical protein